MTAMLQTTFCQACYGIALRFAENRDCGYSDAAVGAEVERHEPALDPDLY